MKRGAVRYVVLRVNSASAFTKLHIASTLRTHLIGVVELPRAASIGRDWNLAMATAGAGGADLAVSADGATASPALYSYLGLLRTATAPSGGAAAAPPADVTPPTEPTNLVLLANSVDSLTVGWDPSTDDAGVTGYEYFLDGTSLGTTQVNYAVISNLVCGTTFTVGVEAFDAAGNHSARASMQAMTQYGCQTGGDSGGGGAVSAPASPPASPSAPASQPAPPPAASAPSAPSGLTQGSTTPTDAMVSWTPSSDPNVTGYDLYFEGLGVDATTQTNYTFSNLSCGTSYTVGVDAHDAAGNRSPVSTLLITSGACPDTTAPTAPANLAQTDATTTDATLSWAPSTDNTAVVGYQVSVDGSPAATTNSPTYSVKGGHCGQTHQVVISAYDAAGNTSPQSSTSVSTKPCPQSQSGDTTPPSTPSGVTVTSSSATTIALTWNASTDNVGVAGYGVYQNGTLVATPTSTSFTLSGLACATSYTVAVDAYDAAGNRSAQTALTASTAACPDTTAPSVPTGLATSNVGQTSLTLSWTASSDNVGVTGYGVYKNGTLTASPSGTSATVSGLVCGTSYTLAVDAVDAAGNRSAKATTTATTTACSDSVAPSTPTGLAVASATQTSVSLSWAASTDNVGVTAYGVYENGTLTASPSGTAATVSGLTCGTSYTFAVDAVDAAGNRSGKASLTASTGACVDTTAPSAPTGLGTSNIGPTSISLSWTASTDNVGVMGYGVYENGTLTASPAGTSATLSGLTCATSYTLAVDAVDAAGNRSGKATVTASTAACPDTTPPSTPTGLSTSNVGQTSLTLSWTASSDNVGVTGYGVYKNGALVASPSGTSTTVSGLACGTSYTLAVDAVDAAGNRSGKGTTTATTSACPDTTAPSAPTGLAVASATQTSVSLSWTASTDNVGVTGYGVYTNGTLSASPSGTSTTLSGLTCGTSYTFAVDAVDAAGNRSTKATVTASTSACPDTTAPSAPTGLATSNIGPTSITLSWSASTDNVGVTGYGVYKNGTLAASPSGTSQTLTGLTCATSYTLAVDAVDAAGNRSTKATVTASTAACPDTTPPSAPSGLATSNVGQTSLTLSWTASTDNVGVTSYGVYRNGTLTASPSGTSSTLSGLTCGTSYTLAVDAVDAAGNRSTKATTTASTAACPDTTPPSTPTGLATSGIGQTSMTLSWNAATDNVGVTGYRVSLNGSQAGTALTTSYLLSNLGCGTTYTLGVAAVDAAGNVSTAATVSAQTAACSPASAPAPTANLYVSTSGNDSTCVRGDATHPCATLPGALAKATAGDTISVADGDYKSGCTISSKFASDVTITGSPSARILCASLDFMGASHIVINGPSLYEVYTDPNSDHLTFENLSITCSDSAPYQLFPPDNLCDAEITVSGTKNVTLASVAVGPSYDSSSCGGNDISKFLGYATITATNVSWRDDRIPTIAACGTHQHTENLMIVDLGPQNGGSVVLNRCYFTNGPNSGTYLGGGTYDGSGADTAELFLNTGDTWSIDNKSGVGNVTIENCLFTGSSEQSIHADDHGHTQDITNSVIQNNTWLLGSTLDYAAGYTNLIIRNNIGANQGCMATMNGGSIKDNVFYDPNNTSPASTCGDSSNVGVGSTGYQAIFQNYTGILSPPASLTPSATSVALNHGDSTTGDYPGTDYLGASRPCGSAPDAGAIERCP